MNFNCLHCKKLAQPILTLVCDHQICLNCAQKIKVPQGKPPLDAKFRITCPGCGKSTVTHNVQNLINEQQQKLLFENIQSSELNESSLGQPVNQDPNKPGWSQRQLKQMSYSQRFSNIWAQRKTPDIADRVSKASNDSKRNANSRSRSGAQFAFSTKCHIHQQVIMFFCEQQHKVMCMQCMYKHTKQFKSHKVLSIKDAIQIISNQNKHFKVQAKKKIQEIQKCINICKLNRGKVEQAYDIHQQLIQKQFKQLELLIKLKQEQVLQYLEKVFQKKQKEVVSQLSDLNYLKNCLKQQYDYTLENFNSQLYFFNTYTIMRGTINKVSTNFKQFEKQQLACFDKLAQKNDFKILLDKFIRPKKDGRQSKGPSRGTSQCGDKIPQKSKAVLYEQYKNAKKKLQKIDKMQKQHKINKQKDKTTNYLNNYIIEIHKKQNQHNPTSSIKQRKSSTTGYYSSHDDKKIVHKALTPTRIVSSRPSKKK